MIDKRFVDFSKEILNLNKSLDITKYENLVLDCNYLFEVFGEENFKKIIKMFLFCIGAKRFDFGIPLYLKISLDNQFTVEIVKYIANWIHFTGRKNQIELVFKATDTLLYQEDVLSLFTVDYLTCMFYLNLSDTNINLDRLKNYISSILLLVEDKDLDFWDRVSLDFNYAANQCVLDLQKDNLVANKAIVKSVLTKTPKIKINISETLKLAGIPVIHGILTVTNTREKAIQLLEYN